MELPKDKFYVCLSFEGFEQELETEIKLLHGKIYHQTERLFITSVLDRLPIWSQNVWLEPQWLEFESLSDAAKKIKSLGPLWANHSFQLHRKSLLIQEKIHRFQPKKIDFLAKIPETPFGAWTLWDEKKILASAKTNSVFALGEPPLNESKSPPSRAYQKLWELFTVHIKTPSKNSHCLDMGCTPGGWTWVLSELGMQVTAVDKAPLDKSLTNRKNIKYIKKDAFQLDPQSIEPVDVFFSDIICDPQRLLELVLKWRSHGVEKFVCTLKFKGQTDFKTMNQFLEIEGSKMVHLYVNKHEVTWYLGF